jgi:hypothetical protein
MAGGDGASRSGLPHGHWQTMTFLAALRHDRITAPCVIDGPINGESFRAYVAQLLVPTLQPGDIVVMDNLGSHKGPAIRRAIRAAGARSSSCRPIAPTSIRSSRSSQSSQSCSARLTNVPPTASGAAPAPFSNTSRRKNALTICATLDMLPPKSERL